MKKLLLIAALSSFPLQAASTQQGLIGASDCRGREATGYIETQNPRSICTGTLIAPNVMLTAAHCVKGKYPDEVFVSFGQDIQEDNWVIDVKDIQVHPRYAPIAGTAVGSPHDVALVILSVDVLRIPADLPNSPIRKGQDIRLEGYGTQEDSTIGIKQCRISTVLNAFDFDFETAGACYGDSGGPAYIGNTVVGITSYITFPTYKTSSPAIDKCKYTAIYMSVHEYLSWIKAQLGDIEPGPPSFGCGGL